MIGKVRRSAADPALIRKGPVPLLLLDLGGLWKEGVQRHDVRKALKMCRRGLDCVAVKNWPASHGWPLAQSPVGRRPVGLIAASAQRFA